MAVTETATVVDLAAARDIVRVELVTLDQLVPADDNPRHDLGDLKDLAASLKTTGQLQNLLVTPIGDGRYRIVAGHRRVAAARLAGLDGLRCDIRELDDQARALAMLEENLLREDLDPLDEGDAYLRLAAGGYSQRRMANVVHRSQSHISKRMAIAQLPAKARDAIAAGKLAVTAAEKFGELTGQVDERYIVAGVDMLLGGRHSHWTPAQVVKEVRDNAARDAKVDQLREQLASAGVTEIEWDGYSGTKFARVDRNGYGNSVNMTVKQHAAEPCHAAYIETGRYGRDPEIVYCCTKPSAHVAKKTRAAAAQADKERAENRNKREARAARMAAMHQVLDGPQLSNAELLSFTLTQLLEFAGNAYGCKVACNLLDIELDKAAYPPNVIREYARQSAANLAKAATAVALGMTEERLNSSYHSWTGDVDITHFAFLTSHGYQPTAWEQQQLGKKR